jgi:DNA-binding CsgD family transcriptional regulator
MGPSAAVQHVRHIAAQGLPARMVVAAMVDALEGVMPSRTRTFMWSGPDGMPGDLYEKEPIVSAFDELLSLMPRLMADLEEPTFDKLAFSNDDYGGWRRFQYMPRYERSALKNVMFKPYGIGNNLDFPIRDSAGMPRAVLAIGREPGSRSYARPEIEAILGLRSHFLHAMDSIAALAASENCGDDGDLEVFLIGDDRTITAARPQGDLMLHQLAGLCKELQRVSCPEAPAPVWEATRRLLAARDGRNVLPPSLEVQTGWGRFKVFAHTRSGCGETVVTIRRQVPRRLCRLKNVAGLDLSPREREVAVAMCTAASGDAIARQVGLSTASYREYARRIYGRLGVEGRIGVKDLLDS